MGKLKSLWITTPSTVNMPAQSRTFGTISRKGMTSFKGDLYCKRIFMLLIPAHVLSSSFALPQNSLSARLSDLQGIWKKWIDRPAFVSKILLSFFRTEGRGEAFLLQRQI